MSYPPPGESPYDVWVEKSNLNGSNLACVAYGALLALFLMALNLLRHRPQGSRDGLYSSALIAYIVWIFVLATIAIALQCKWTEMTYITDRGYPGGPNAFVLEQYGNSINVADNAAFIVLNWFADGMMLYRFLVIYNHRLYLAIFPALLLAASFAMGVLVLRGIAEPGGNLNTAIDFGIPYWTISVSLNVIVTVSIVGRLLYIRMQSRHVFDVIDSNYTRPYTTVAAMIVESASIYSITGIVYIVAYGIGSPVQNLLLPLLGIVQAISPLLIVVRVAQGRAWSHETAAHMTAIKFTTSTYDNTATSAPSNMGLEHIALPVRKTEGCVSGVFGTGYGVSPESSAPDWGGSGRVSLDGKTPEGNDLENRVKCPRI